MKTLFLNTFISWSSDLFETAVPFHILHDFIKCHLTNFEENQTSHTSCAMFCVLEEVRSGLSPPGASPFSFWGWSLLSCILCLSSISASFCRNTSVSLHKEVCPFLGDPVALGSAWLRWGCEDLLLFSHSPLVCLTVLGGGEVISFRILKDQLLHTLLSNL